MTSNISEQETSISRRVIEAVAEECGTAPANLREPLHNAIDPDALDALYSGDRSPSLIEFTYNGYRIEIDDRKITLHERS